MGTESAPGPTGYSTRRGGERAADDDVEGHGPVRPKASDDDVEGHGPVRPKASDDDVEGHIQVR
jgi:hypothetical protein